MNAVTLVADAVASAESAGLRYVADDRPGITRRRVGKGFAYRREDGAPMRDAATLERIRKLAIPPAWTSVWICPTANGHIQATGRDAKRRKQYRYHARWRVVRDETKYEKMLTFGHALPKIRAAIDRDMREQALTREKVLATVVRLLELTHIRVGNEEYARANGSFGLTTLRARHVEVDGTTIHFRFRGKSGKSHAIRVRDKRLARIVARCSDLPGYDLFRWVDEAGDAHPIESSDVNEYVRAIADEELTAKDFRTWAGTVLAARELRATGEFASETEASKNVVAAIRLVSERLGNTPSVCRKCYVHPAVIDAYVDGVLVDAIAAGDDAPASPSSVALSAEEKSVLALLERRGVGEPRASIRSVIARGVAVRRIRRTR